MNNEEFMAAVFSQASVGLALISAEGRFQRVNQELCRLLGSECDDLIGRMALSLTHPDDLEECTLALRRAMTEGKTISLDKRFIRPDGEIVWARSSVTRIDNHDGELVSMLGVVVDLTERKRAEDVLRASEERYRTLFESIDQGFCVIQLLYEEAAKHWDCRFLEVNPAFERHSGLKGAVGKRMRELAPHIEEGWFNIYVEVARSGESVRFDSHVQALNRWFSVNAFRVGDPADRRVAILFSDVTRQKAVQNELYVTNERLKLAIEGAGDGVWDWDIATSRVTFSARWCEMLGYAEGEVSTMEAWRRRVHPDDLGHVHAGLQSCLDGAAPSYISEHRMLCKDGSWKWVLARGIVVARDSHQKALRMTGTSTDISKRKQMDEQIWRHANFDMLTGLPNRRLFRDRLDQEVRKAHRTGNHLGLLFIDLDRFKEVNDLLGHDAGDQLLQQAAKRLQGCVRKSDTVARLGGDEFTVILAELDNLEHVEQVSRKVLETLSQPFRIGTERAYLSGSIGITLFPQDASCSEEMIRKADQAMYAAKNSGKNRFSYFTQAMDEKAQQKMKLAAELRNALEAGQLEVHYQPVVDLALRRIVKAEALLRWRHPKLGMVEPSRFIPLAEESGLINEIGNWVFAQAAKCSKRWGSELGTPFQISVNKSPAQFLLQAGPDDWLRFLERINLPKKSISVEITEGILLHASASVTEKLLEYRDAGVQVAIDDFGTGYSSMAYLKKFDIDYLKIDRSFVSGMETDSGSRTIAESIIVMAHRLGLKVIAEGVETIAQRELLTAAGCDYGQGFLFSQPLPPEKFEKILLRKPAGEPTAEVHH